MLELPFPSRPVLCVTSNPHCREAIESAMTGFRPVFAANASDALRATNTGVFDAFAIEFWLPDWPGVQLCRQLRTNDPHAPIMVFNAGTQGSDGQRALRAGASACFVKPLDLVAIRSSLVTLLNQRDHQSVRARIEEQNAVHDELTRQAALAFDHARHATELAASANERIARMKAYKAFIEAGGMRSHFDRWWPQVYDAVRGKTPASSAQSGATPADR